VLNINPSYEFARQSDTGLRAKIPGVSLGLTRDLGKSGRISGKVAYTNMITSPRNVYVPFQVAQGMGPGNNIEANLSGRLAVTKNGRFDLSYRFEGFSRRPDRHIFRLEFVVLFL
jgi:hypothetical protein